MEKPSAAKSVMGGLFTAAKWLVFAAVVAGTIAAFAPAGGIAAALGVAAEATGFTAFKAGAIGLFTSAPLWATGIGGLSFLKGAVSTHKIQKAQIEQREMEAAARQQAPSQTVEKGAARGVTFELAAGHPANDKSKTGVSFRTQVDTRRDQTAARSPGA